MPPTSRTAASVRSRTRPNSLPRWLCSRMPMPEPSRSQIASCARRRTSSGSIAGPDEKLSFRTGPTASATLNFFVIEHGDRDAVERFVRRLRDDELRHHARRIRIDPVRDLLAELIAIRDHGRREHLHSVKDLVLAEDELSRLVGCVRGHPRTTYHTLFVIVERTVEGIRQPLCFLRRHVCRSKRFFRSLDERNHARLLDGEPRLIVRDPFVELFGQALLWRAKLRTERRQTLRFSSTAVRDRTVRDLEVAPELDHVLVAFVRILLHRLKDHAFGLL